MAVLVLAAISSVTSENFNKNPWTAETAHNRAALVDELSGDRPDPFVDSVRNTLLHGGYDLHYYAPSEVTVQLFKELPTLGYGLVIIRAHTIYLNIVGRFSETLKGGTRHVEPVIADVGVVTSEPYSGSSHVYEQTMGELMEAQEGNRYFAITPSFVQNEMQGTFPNSIVVLMGCGGVWGQNDGMVRALLDKGAGAYIGWDNTVTKVHTDIATLAVLQSLVQGKGAQEAVSSAMREAGPDPEFQSYLREYDMKTYPNSQVTVDPIPSLFTIIALVAVSPTLLIGAIVGVASRLPRKN